MLFRSFLEVTREKTPVRFEKIEQVNKLWLDFRMDHGEPVSSELIQAASMTMEDLDDDEPLTADLR